MRKTLDFHRAYDLIWEKSLVGEYRGAILNEINQFYYTQILPHNFQKFRSKLFGIFGLTHPVDRLSEKLTEVDKLRQVDNDIYNKFHDLLCLYVDDPQDTALVSKATEIQLMINDNLIALSKLMYNKEIRTIKEVIQQGRMRLTSMGEIERQLEDFVNAEELLESELDYEDQVSLSYEIFDQIQNIKKDAEIIVKDATMPAILKYLSVFAGLIIAGSVLGIL